MANNGNGIITAPVRVREDVKGVLKESSNNVSVLCKSDEVNMWSRHKPQKVAVDGTTEPTFFEDQTAREAAFKKGCYGLTNIPFFTRAQNMVDWMRGTIGSTYPSNYPGMTKAESWSWRKPVKCRVGDFNKYNHKAQPIVLDIPGPITVPTVGTVYVDVELGYTGIRVQDLCQQGVWLPYGSSQHSNACNPTDLRLGLCFIKSGTSSKSAIVFSDKYALNESNSMSFSFLASQFGSIFSAPAGTYKVFVFLGAMDSMPSGLVSVSQQTGVFYPINCSEREMTVKNQAADVTVHISGYKETESQRTVSFEFWVQNRSDFGFYIEPRVYLVQGDAEMELDGWYAGGRRYLAKGSQSGDMYSYSGSLDAKGLSSELKLKAIVDIFETDTATQVLETAEKTSVVSIGELPRD